LQNFKDQEQNSGPAARTRPGAGARTKSPNPTQDPGQIHLDSSQTRHQTQTRNQTNPQEKHRGPQEIDRVSAYGKKIV
tara:strand:- start:1218 stop:1451 length:234 start_codon:yes stop_codon:yes gene_type:complete